MIGAETIGPVEPNERGRGVAVVAHLELPEQPDEMALVDHDDLVRALPAESPQQLSAIAITFAFGALVQGPDAGYTEVGPPGVEIPAVGVVRVID